METASTETSSYSATSASNQSSIAVGDFRNGDGFVDAAVAGDDGNVAILINDGTGGFQSGDHRERLGSGPYSVVAGDFNNDGNNGSQAFSDFTDDNVSVILGA